LASTVSCIGLGPESEEELMGLLDRVVLGAEVVAARRGLEIRRWEDASGARVTVGLRGGNRVEDLIPWLASEPGARLGPLSPAEDGVHVGDVLDGDGETAARGAFEVAQRPQLAGAGHPGGPAAIVALGTEMTVSDDADTFATSPASLLDPTAEPGEPGGDLRLAAESFIPLGLFGAEAGHAAEARLAAVVIASDRRINALSGLPFVVARTRTAGMEIDVCLDGREHPGALRPGQVISGLAHMIASVRVEAAGPARRRFGWGRA
jgi:hypothetical protein